MVVLFFTGARRLLQIAVLMLYHFCHLALRILTAAKPYSRSFVLILVGRELRDLLIDLGPAFVKVGQILSMRADLVPVEVTVALTTLQNQTRPFDSRKVPKLIEEAFSRSVDQLFEYFDMHPIASASIAQVHRARLWDGREVAVKIRRPGIVRQVHNDLRLLGVIAKLMSAIPATHLLPLTDFVKEIGKPILGQLDFKREADNIRKFRANFQLVEYITMPVLIEELCTSSILTTEFLDGLKKVTSVNSGVYEREIAALAGLRALYKMIFLDGFVHADMHAGNVFLRSFGEFVILDMGLVTELSNSQLRAFVEFFFGLVNNQGKVCARILHESATHCAVESNRDGFENAVVDLVSKHSRLSSKEFEITRFVFGLIEIHRRFGVRASMNFMTIVLSMVVFDGICKLLYPALDFQREARPFLIAAKYRRNQLTFGARAAAR